MEPYWQRHVFISSSRSESAFLALRITCGLTGPQLVLSVGDESIVIASKWKEWVSEHGNRDIVDAINEGVQFLRDMKA